MIEVSIQIKSQWLHGRYGMRCDKRKGREAYQLPRNTGGRIIHIGTQRKQCVVGIWGRSNKGGRSSSPGQRDAGDF